MITLLSVPRTGTHFLLYLLLVKLKVNVQCDHFHYKAVNRINNLLNIAPKDHIFIVTKGNKLRVKEEFPIEIVDSFYAIRTKFLHKLKERNAIFFNVKERKGINKILNRLNIEKDAEINSFIEEWPRISLSHISKYLIELQNIVTDEHRMRVKK